MDGLWRLSLLASLALGACTGGAVRDASLYRPDAQPALDAAPAGDAALEDAPPGDAAQADASEADATALDAAVDGGTDQVELTFEVTIPADTPAGSTVHVAGNFQSWDPADPAYALTPAGGRLHTITLRFMPGQSLEFKFARGDWSRVEKGPAGEEIANRTLLVSGPGRHSFSVASWADTGTQPGTRTGDITETSVPGFLGGRRVWVYLPPGYHAATERYPVLYMFDGQNVFDQATSFSGEWQVDEALESAIPAAQVEPLIVVAVDNGGASRIEEYTPWPRDNMGTPQGGGGEAQLMAIITVLKPWVDASYRTRTTPVDTGLAGSSLGGLMGVYAAYAHSDVFGKIAALSPSVWWADEMLVGFVSSGSKPPVRLWTDVGTAEGDLGPFRRLRDALLADGFVEGQDLTTLEDLGAGHNEAAWARRFPDVLRFLFPR